MENTQNKNMNTDMPKPYVIREEELLYKLSDAGLLCYAFKIKPNRDDASKRVWFFERNDDVWAVIRKYLNDKKAEQVKNNENGSEENVYETHTVSNR